MKQLLTILLLFISLASFGQSKVPCCGSKTTDTGYVRGSFRVDSGFILKRYATNDSDKVVGVDENGNLVLRTKGNFDNASIPQIFSETLLSTSGQYSITDSSNLKGTVIMNVNINGSSLYPSIDYTFDSSLGKITLTDTLPANQRIIITYKKYGFFVSPSNYYTKTDIANIGIAPVSYYTQVTQPVDKNTCSYINTNSTFSGWFFTIGNPTNIDAIVYQLRTRSTAPTKIVRCARIHGYSGTVVQLDTELVSMQPNTVYTDTMKLNTTYTGSDTLYVSYQTDQYIDNFCRAASVFTVPPYDSTRYITGGNLSITGWAKAAQEYDMWFVTLQSHTDILPTTTFSNSVYNTSTSADTDRQKVAEIYPNVSTSLTSGYDTIKSVPVWNNPPSEFLNYSSFNGGCSPIPKTDSFNAIEFYIHSRSTNINPITKVAVTLYDSTTSGTLLGIDTLTGLNIGGGQIDTLLFILDSTIHPQHSMAFSFSADDSLNVWGVQGTSVPLPSTSYFGYKYHTGTAISTTPNTWNTISGLPSAQINIFVKYQYVNPVGIPTASLMKYINNRVAPAKNPLSSLVTAQIIAPKNIYCTTGYETDVYWYDIIKSNVSLNNLSIDAACAKGQQLDREWRFVPAISDTGSTTLTVNVSSLDGVLLATDTFNVYVTAATKSTGKTIHVLTIGDSKSAGAGKWQDSLNNSCPPSIVVNNPAQSGYKWIDWATNTRTRYYFYVHGVTSAGTGASIYTTNSSSYTISEINLTGGTGYISGQKTSGTNNPLSSGTLTLSSGTGDATITFDSVKTASGNPLWDSTLGGVSFTYYLTNAGFTMDSTSIVMAMLGTNDYFGTATPALNAQVKSYIDTIINACHRDLPKTKFIIMLPDIGNYYQSGFGNDYGSGQTNNVFANNIFYYDSSAISWYDNDSFRTQGVYVLNANATLDLKYNMQHTNVPANAYNNSDSVTQGTNGVHPAPSGYWQIGVNAKNIVKSLTAYYTENLFDDTKYWNYKY